MKTRFSLGIIMCALFVFCVGNQSSFAAIPFRQDTNTASADASISSGSSCDKAEKMRMIAVKNTLEALQHTWDYMYASEKVKWKPVLDAMQENIKEWPYKKYDSSLIDRQVETKLKDYVSETGALFPVIIRKCAELVTTKSCDLEQTKEQITSLYILYVALFDAAKLEYSPENINDFCFYKDDGITWFHILVPLLIAFAIILIMSGKIVRKYSEYCKDR